MIKAIPIALSILGALTGVRAVSESERVSELLTRGAEIEAVQVHPSIWLASGNSNAYLVETKDGVVVIDTGIVSQAGKTHETLSERAGDLPLRTLVFTHAHEDHVSGAAPWLAENPEIIAHRDFPLRQQYFAMLAEYKARRAGVLWAGVMNEADAQLPVPSITPDVLVDDLHVFEVGGLRFEVHATPGGEGPDAVSVWIPEWKVLFTGDAFGPTRGAFPNLFTLRGENLRESIPLLDSIERMQGLSPELLLPGHFEPLAGAAEIQSTLQRTSDAIRSVHDQTIAGMNAGKDVWTLMREVTLPPELALSEEYGRVAWGVRAIYELHTGWFRYESTTELFEVPARAVYPELARLAGGATAVAASANARIEAGDALGALHLAEVALAGEPSSRPALQAQLGALEMLARQDAGSNFQVAGWLRHRISAVKAQLGAID